MKVINISKGKLSQIISLTFMLGSSVAFASDINFSGFLTLSGGMVDDEDSIAYSGYEEEDFTLSRNLLGLQATGQVSEKVTATAQLIARSGDGYQVNSEWAYLTWQAKDNLKIRVGRLRTPFYMYSDSIDVGYSYAWIRPPQEVYASPFNNTDGVDVYLTDTLGNFDVTLQTYFGSFSDEFVLGGYNTPTTVRNQMGLATTLGRDWWTLRAARHQFEATLNLAGFPLGPQLTMGGLADYLISIGYPENSRRLLLEKDDLVSSQLGFTMDTGRFVAGAEYLKFEPGESFISTNKRRYLMLGVRAGEWLFHVTAIEARDEVSHPERGIPAGQTIPMFGNTNALIGMLQGIARSQATDRDVISLGTRWDVASGTAIKFQFDDVDDRAGDQKVYSFAVQTVF